MRVVYHLVPRQTWESSPPGPYHDPSLEREGFLHCSNADQVERVANLLFSEIDDLLALCIDAGYFGDKLQDELAAVIGGTNPFEGETFPHLYSALERSAILSVVPLTRDEAGRLRFSVPG